MTKHCETRRKVRAITTKKEFNDLLEKCILTEGETALMRMHYLEDKDFRYIGDKLGFAEQTMMKCHATMRFWDLRGMPNAMNTIMPKRL